jgi:hypothetical protein
MPPYDVVDGKSVPQPPAPHSDIVLLRADPTFVSKDPLTPYQVGVWIRLDLKDKVLELVDPFGFMTPQVFWGMGNANGVDVAYHLCISPRFNVNEVIAYLIAQFKVLGEGVQVHVMEAQA